MSCRYSNNEYADIVYLYGFFNGNSNDARREYIVRFPNRRLSDKSIFSFMTFQ